MGRKVFRRSVTTTSTTLSDLGEIGDVRVEGKKKYRLVYCATTQEAGTALAGLLALDSVDAALASYTVQAVPASTSYLFGVNDTGASLASGTYFWCMVEGMLAVTSKHIDTDADIGAETPLYLNSDKRLSTTAATNTPEIGVSIVSLTSVETDTPSGNLLIKGLGA